MNVKHSVNIIFKLCKHKFVDRLLSLQISDYQKMCSDNTFYGKIIYSDNTCYCI